jgi:uncharacterized phiE125 gp8 family phage protein
VLYRTAASPIPLISLQEIKTHLRLDHALEDEYLENLIQGSTEWVEHEIGRALLHQTWVMIQQQGEHHREHIFDQQTTIIIDLPYPPIVEILSIETVLADDVKRPIRRYVLNTNHLMPRIFLGYQKHPICVTYRCGYGERPMAVPPTLRQAVMTVATQLYENRNQSTELLKTPLLQSLLNPFRVMRIR